MYLQRPRVADYLHSDRILDRMWPADTLQWEWRHGLGFTSLGGLLSSILLLCGLFLARGLRLGAAWGRIGLNRFATMRVSSGISDLGL